MSNTPIPWYYAIEGTYGYIINSEGEAIMEVRTLLNSSAHNDLEDNLKYLTRAVNAHDNLVAACKEALTCATVKVPYAEQAEKSAKVIEMLKAEKAAKVIEMLKVALLAAGEKL